MPTPTTPARSVWASTGELQKVPPFRSQAHKAYLALTSEMAMNISGFLLPGDVTGIDTPLAPGTQPLVVYTLTGVRLHPSTLSDLPAGIYIVNGKKMVIK